MSILTFETYSEEETKNIGRLVGSRVKAGDVISLTGDLGAGKTHFTMGVAESLGINENITSPTFTIVNEYRSGKLPLFHIDAYRLSCGDDLLEIGYDEYVDQRGIIIIEWADIVEDILPPNAIKIEIQRQDNIDLNTRKIIVKGDEGFDNIGH